MFGIGKRKSILEEEDLCCRYCEYAEVREQDVFCLKKKSVVETDGKCSAFAYDLLKRCPVARGGAQALAEPEFPII